LTTFASSRFLVKDDLPCQYLPPDISHPSPASLTTFATSRFLVGDERPRTKSRLTDNFSPDFGICVFANVRPHTSGTISSTIIPYV
jgi:hypothetical protein